MSQTTNASNPTQASREQVMQYILGRSATDAAFRAQLVADPHAAFAAVTKKDKSAFAHLDISFIEPTADVVIVLPKFGEVDDADLEAVSGGSLGLLEKGAEKILEDIAETFITIFEHGQTAITGVQA